MYLGAEPSLIKLWYSPTGFHQCLPQGVEEIAGPRTAVIIIAVPSIRTGMTAITIGGTNNEVIARTRREGTGFWLHLFFEVQAKRHSSSVSTPVGARYFIEN